MYKQRMLDLLSMFKWHEGIVECLCGLGDPRRYVIVSRNRSDESEHWVDGMADDWLLAAEVVAEVDPEWVFVGVFDLDGEPGSEVKAIPVRLHYVVGEGFQMPAGTYRDHSLDGGDPVGSHDSEWAETIYEVEG